MSTAFAARPLPPEAPTHEELTHELRNLVPSMHVYNPAPEWVPIDHGGRTYWIPPDRGGEAVPHPVDVHRDAQGNILGPVMVSGNGTLGIRDLWGGKKYVKGAPTDFGPAEGQAAWEVVKFMAEHHAHRGIIYLRGNPTDEQRKAGAKRAYHAYIRTWALEQKQSRDEFVANWRNQPGNRAKDKFPPRMLKVQLQAQNILDEIGTDERDGLPAFNCVRCFNYETDEWDKFVRHMGAAHGLNNLRREDYDPALQEKGARQVSGQGEGPEEPEPGDEDEDGDEPTSPQGRKAKRRV